jgi:hypothetical protein
MEGHVMTWGNGGNAAIAEPSPQPAINTDVRDQLLAKWDEAKKVLDAAKTSEMEARKAVSDYCFPNASEGTNRIELNNGFALKCVAKLNWKIAAPNDQVDKIEEEAAKLGNEGTFLIERIITWTPGFSKSEYKKLDPSLPTHAKVKALVDSVLDITPGAPTLTIEEPKATLNG